MAWCAGFVDVAAYQRLSRTYTSHMTGNTASLASHMVKGEWADAARFIVAIASFLAGLLISAALQHLERRQGVRSAFAAVLALEVLLLAVFIPLSGVSSAPLPLLIFLPAAAMGMQTVTVTRVGRLRVYTTYLTGGLSKFSEAVTGCLFADCDRREAARQAAITGGIWLAFLLGGLSGATAERAWGAIALLTPMLILCATIPVDLLRPRALGDADDD
jgi:uncharacterized membrane protein YoaK (UPF0700 family)